MSAAMANLALAPVLVPLTGAVGCVLLAGRPRRRPGFADQTRGNTGVLPDFARV